MGENHEKNRRVLTVPVKVIVYGEPAKGGTGTLHSPLLTPFLPGPDLVGRSRAVRFPLSPVHSSGTLNLEPGTLNL